MKHLLAILALALAAVPAQASLLPAQKATVVHVHDGDTLRVYLNNTYQTIRVLGIDTPEIPPRPAECFGADAQAYANVLLYTGRPIWIQEDSVAGDHDRYGRKLREVRFYNGSRPGRTLERKLLLGGFANVYDYHHQALRDLAAWVAQRNNARAAGRGAWTLCPGASTSIFTGWQTGPA